MSIAKSISRFAAQPTFTVLAMMYVRYACSKTRGNKVVGLPASMSDDAVRVQGSDASAELIIASRGWIVHTKRIFAIDCIWEFNFNGIYQKYRHYMKQSNAPPSSLDKRVARVAQIVGSTAKLEQLSVHLVLPVTIYLVCSIPFHTDVGSEDLRLKRLVEVDPETCSGPSSPARPCQLRSA